MTHQICVFPLHVATSALNDLITIYRSPKSQLQTPILIQTKPRFPPTKIKSLRYWMFQFLIYPKLPFQHLVYFKHWGHTAPDLLTLECLRIFHTVLILDNPFHPLHRFPEILFYELSYMFSSLSMYKNDKFWFHG